MKHLIKYSIIYFVVFVFVDSIEYFYCSSPLLLAFYISTALFVLLLVGKQKVSLPSNWYHVFISAIFILFLSLPFIQYTFNPIPKGELTSTFDEKRKLAEKPDFKRLDINEFPEQITTYFNDNFELRKWFIAWNNYVKVKYLKISPRPNITLGKGDWMFFTLPGVQANHEGTKKFSDKELEKILTTQKKRYEYLKGKGIEYYIAIAPDKYSVYPEYLPLNCDYSKTTQTDQLITYLKANSKIKIIDLRADIDSAKNFDQLYYKTDSHWNHNGGFIGCQTILKRIKVDLPSIPVFTLDDYTRTSEIEEKGGDLAIFLALRPYYTSNNFKYTPKPNLPKIQADRNIDWNKAYNGSRTFINTSKPGLPRLVNFHDSFSNYTKNFLGTSFSRSCFVWTYDFRKDIIEKEKPEVVLYTIVERNIKKLASDKN